MGGVFQQWLPILGFMLMVLRIESINVDITYVESAVAKGAVCLDGSPPAYHFDKGYGAGANSWLIQIEVEIGIGEGGHGGGDLIDLELQNYCKLVGQLKGGGWCNNVTTCLARKNTRLGSSKQMVQQLAFSGILSNNPQFNPDFYNWNRIKVRYCDGASFTGDIEAVNPATNLHYRGARVFLAVMEDLFSKGMKNAENTILSGCSAGGLTSILHCDSFQALFPMGTTVKCFSDAGYFIDARDVSGALHIADFYNDVVRTHGSAKNLPASCTSRLSPGLCFFPQHVAQGLRTPLFILNAAYDSWQIKNILAPGVADPHGIWHDCKLDILKCSGSQLEIMQGFRAEFLYALSEIGSSSSRGYFINSCYAHCQTEMQETWLSAGSPVLNDKTIAEAMGDWFYDRTSFQKIDCPYPCDKTCHNRVFDSQEHPLI